MSVDWHFVVALYVANCISQALPVPSGANELYLFVYRLFHLLLLNIGNIIQTALPAKIKVLEMSSASTLPSGSETSYSSKSVITEEK